MHEGNVRKRCRLAFIHPTFFPRKNMDILLAFTGFQDPYFNGLIDPEEQPGPILSLLGTRSFDRLFLFDTPGNRLNTEKTKAAVSDLYPGTSVHILETNLIDPFDYHEILKVLRMHFQVLFTESGSGLFFALSSGTPQMHACWVLLAVSGEFPTRILHVVPTHSASGKPPLVTDADLSVTGFPKIGTGFQTTPVKEIEIDSYRARAKLGIVGDHPAIERSLEMAAMLAASPAPILITGETGTGKELFARYIHVLSGRGREPLVPVNCAAIPENLMESLLFGHKKGSFTGALKDHAGKFDAADGGTLFLDEIGDLTIAAQAKLLRILQDGWVEPIGEERGHQVDVRIVAATHRDLPEMVGKGSFREDLFYRLNAGEIRLPPLRERRSDIPGLALSVLSRLNRSLRLPKRLSADALLRLQTHDWPGNVRDLENVLERSIRLCRGDVLGAENLLISGPVKKADPFNFLPDPYEGFSLDEFLGRARTQIILRALEAAGGNQSRAARMLGITPQAVNKFLCGTRKSVSTEV